jgi:hypothetical protein
MTIGPEPPQAPIASVRSPTDTTAHVVRIAATPSFVLAPPPSAAAPTVRPVRFYISPKGARLFIDGTEEKRWLSTPVPLSVGNHAVEVTPNDANCCQKSSTTVVVEAPPSDKPDAEKPVYLQMQLNPAAVTLAASAPRGASVFCPEIGLTVPAGVSVSAKLRDAQQMVTCSFLAPDRPTRQHTVTLEAGGMKVIPWPD